MLFLAILSILILHCFFNCFWLRFILLAVTHFLLGLFLYLRNNNLNAEKHRRIYVRLAYLFPLQSLLLTFDEFWILTLEQ